MTDFGLAVAKTQQAAENEPPSDSNLKETLEARKKIERAKGLLMQQGEGVKARRTRRSEGCRNISGLKLLNFALFAIYVVTFAC
jgi:hypothetical protein